MKTYPRSQIIPRKLASRVWVPYLILNGIFPFDAVYLKQLAKVTRRQDEVVECWQGLECRKRVGRPTGVESLLPGWVEWRNGRFERGTCVVEGAPRRNGTVSNHNGDVRYRTGRLATSRECGEGHEDEEGRCEKGMGRKVHPCN